MKTFLAAKIPGVMAKYKKFLTSLSRLPALGVFLGLVGAYSVLGLGILSLLVSTLTQTAVVVTISLAIFAAFIDLVTISEVGTRETEKNDAV